MNYWLMKSEPEECSIDSLAQVDREPWTGVRNYLARNYMKTMQLGDGVLFYHSNVATPGITGIAEVVSDVYADPTQFERRSDYYDASSARNNPRWWLVDIKFKRKLKRIISLDELKAQADQLDDFLLLRRGSRLSVMPVTAEQWRHILSLE